jgi:hypothetical protein
MSSYVVAHQMFAMTLLTWLEQVTGHSGKSSNYYYCYHKIIITIRKIYVVRGVTRAVSEIRLKDDMSGCMMHTLQLQYVEFRDAMINRRELMPLNLLFQDL